MVSAVPIREYPSQNMPGVTRRDYSTEFLNIEYSIAPGLPAATSITLINHLAAAFIHKLYGCLSTIVEPLSVRNHGFCTMVVIPVDGIWGEGEIGTPYYNRASWFRVGKWYTCIKSRRCSERGSGTAAAMALRPGRM